MGTMKTRAIVLGCLRALSTLSIAVALVMIGNRLLFGMLSSGSIEDAWSVWTGIGAWHGVYLGLPLFFVGLAGALASDALAEWIVRPPGQGCPGCGYASEAPAGAPCPECGRVVAKSPASASGPTRDAEA